MKNITITIAGPTGSGKSRVLYLLKQVLKGEGFEVEFDGSMDFENSKQFDEYMVRDIEDVIPHIALRTKIKFDEVQTNKPIEEYGMGFKD